MRRDVFAEFHSRRAFAESESIIRYRAWAADKRTNYESRIMYDQWCSVREQRIIEHANKLIRHLGERNA